MGVAKCPNTLPEEYYCIDSGDSSVNCTAEFNVFEFLGNKSSRPLRTCSALVRYKGTPSALTTVGVIGKAMTTLSIAISSTPSTTTLSIDVPDCLPIKLGGRCLYYSATAGRHCSLHSRYSDLFGKLLQQQQRRSQLLNHDLQITRLPLGSVWRYPVV